MSIDKKDAVPDPRTRIIRLISNNDVASAIQELLSLSPPNQIKHELLVISADYQNLEDLFHNREVMFFHEYELYRRKILFRLVRIMEKCFQ